MKKFNIKIIILILLIATMCNFIFCNCKEGLTSKTQMKRKSVGQTIPIKVYFNFKSINKLIDPLAKILNNSLSSRMGQMSTTNIRPPSTILPPSSKVYPPSNTIKK